MARRLSLLVLLLFILLLGLAACSTKERPVPANGGMTASIANAASSAPGEFSLDDYDEPDQIQVFDPLEPWNRFWFRFNDVMLLNVLKPIHRSYAYVVPGILRSGISQFANNLASPVRFLNSLLQGKVTQAGVEFGRFFINTVTSLGFADVASQSKPLYPYHPEQAHFGHTLMVWGIPEGPYLIWPFLGPSTARGTIGMAGNGFMTPQSYAMPFTASMGVNAGFTFNGLDHIYTPYEKITKAALEPYVAVRNGYLSLLRQQETRVIAK